ncbi:LysR family transcriptional regulator [Paenibacillus apiarius]|uniref:LysR family transcriptional regulator n=1 Tax=Paenibacillus apiarius TaxID=46240 RepID=A0ABT4DQD6_9BACL|nr:LysR family transcriptional regulator [Paenibacillus apiarius]MCY9516330.1 LysR family transcriptional regulator [Paenibacillus apiarius]MCY9519572.1 LysR family transcriptional regulator [Paenibacillus apiarius]MCY9554666.1 LysR family transcriptional regulator [Paenibacillus apiarius]MCY9561507.1 LysR family transcriptional regulator [Paenibacillus apiarius]MCY9684262.1 LysR family transcriptional regulator [Paenibacillus apiarius]
MDIEQLEAFLAVVKSKNFTKSAESLHVAQSTVTSRIKTLEELMGTALLIRNNKHVALTQAGLSFLPYAERMMSLYEASKEALKLQQKYSERFVLGGPTSAWMYIFGDQLRDFQRNNPAIACELLTHSSENTLEKVIDGIIHVGIAYMKPRHPRLAVHHIIEDDYVFVARQRLARKLTLEDLHRSNFVLNDWGKPFMDWFYNEMGERYMPAFKMNQTTIVIKRCLEENWFTLIPKSIVKNYIENKDLHILDHELAWQPPKHNVYAVTLKTIKNSNLAISIAELVASLYAAR